MAGAIILIHERASILCLLQEKEGWSDVASSHWTEVGPLAPV